MNQCFQWYFLQAEVWNQGVYDPATFSPWWSCLDQTSLTKYEQRSNLHLPFVCFTSRPIISDQLIHMISPSHVLLCILKEIGIIISNNSYPPSLFVEFLQIGIILQKKKHMNGLLSPHAIKYCLLGSMKSKQCVLIRAASWLK